MPKLKFEITEESFEHIKRLIVKSGSKHLGETLIKAFALLDIACDMEAEGGKLFVERANGEKERLPLVAVILPPDAGPREIPPDARGGEK